MQRLTRVGELAKVQLLLLVEKVRFQPFGLGGPGGLTRKLLIDGSARD